MQRYWRAVALYMVDRNWLVCSRVDLGWVLVGITWFLTACQPLIQRLPEPLFDIFGLAQQDPTWHAQNMESFATLLKPK